MPRPKREHGLTRRKARHGAALPDVAPSERRRAQRLYRKLEEIYPDATCALHHDNPWQLLVATILSAQCTDVRVNLVTPELFRKYPGPAELARAKRGEIEKLIKTTGFFRNKAKSIQGAAIAVVDEHDGEVPETMEALLDLPGVARKTANVVLGNAFDKNEGVVVDTHVARLSYRLGLTDHRDVKKIERDLMARFPQQKWTMLAHLLIAHGRGLCKARSPICSQCPLLRSCPQREVENAK